MVNCIIEVTFPVLDTEIVCYARNGAIRGPAREYNTPFYPRTDNWGPRDLVINQVKWGGVNQETEKSYASKCGETGCKGSGERN